MEKEQPAYYAVIPARVRYADIMPNAKLLYGEITALANSKGYCWASNAHFAELYGVSEKQVSLWFKQLIDKKLIETEIIKTQNGTMRKCFVLEEKVIRTLRKGFAHYQKVTGTLPKGNVGIEVGTLPKGNTNNKDIILNINKAVLAEEEPTALDFRGEESPAKEKIRAMLASKGLLKTS